MVPESATILHLKLTEKNYPARLDKDQHSHCSMEQSAATLCKVKNTREVNNQIKSENNSAIHVKTIMIFHMLIKAGPQSREWFSVIVDLIWGNPSHASHNAQISHNLHQNDTSVESFLASQCVFFLFKKANKSHFCSGWISTNGWGAGGEMLDAFIKYGNLLNGLWQSHWRSLFRCRWLPPYWLPLSLAEPPVREKEKKTPSCFHRLTVNHCRCLSVCMWDWLLPVCAPSQPCLTHTIPPLLSKNSPLMQQEENKPSFSWTAACVWRHAQSWLSWCEREMGRWHREQV